MTELLTSAQMRAIEQAAIASGEVTGLALMERAGRGVVEAIFEHWPELGAAAGAAEYLGKEEATRRAVVLCGPGNNGGDGFVVARLLRERGWAVEVFLYGDPQRLPPDVRVNYERWLEVGSISKRPFSDDVAGPGRPLLIDALFGTGLTRPVGGALAEAVDCVCRCFAPEQIVAVDIRSGICADSGKDLSARLSGSTEAGLTVTFHRPKVGHYVSDGGAASTRLRVVDIGLARPVTQLSYREIVHLTCGTQMLQKEVGEHKYSHGHALILSGPPGHGGAARLAARGALRIGAGLVTVGCPPEAQAEHAARLDAVMLRPVADAAALAEILSDKRLTALCLGPGLGVGERAADLLETALRCTAPEAEQAPHLSGAGAAKAALVLDADALTILSRRPDLFARLHDGCVLTPHGGEFARLFPDIADQLAAPATSGPAYSKVDATREAAARAGCVVLFKGPDTVIADPSGRAAINSAHYDRAAPWLATAGSGDVLAGFVAGLLARGFGPFDAACTAAWLHVECARAFGPGLIAEDLPEELPKVFRALGL